MTPEIFVSMAEAWYQVYAPIARIGVIVMVVVAFILGVLLFTALLLRNYLSSSIRMPS